MNELWVVETRSLGGKWEIDGWRDYDKPEAVFMNRESAEKLCAEHDAIYHTDFEHRVRCYAPQEN